MANAAPIVYTNAYVFISTSTSAPDTDLSSVVRSLEFTIEAEELDVTAMGTNGWRALAVGLKTGNINLNLYQDFESTGKAIDKKFYDLVNNAILFNLALRPFNAARTSDNPEYQVPVRSYTHNPMSGEVGTVLMTPVRLRAAGAVVRVTSSS